VGVEGDMEGGMGANISKAGRLEIVEAKLEKRCALDVLSR